MKKTTIAITINGFIWIVAATFMLLGDLLVNVAPKQLLPPNIQSLQLLGYAQILAFLIIGIGLMKLRQWAWILALILTLSYFVHVLWVLINIKHILFLDSFFCIYQLSLLLNPRIKKYFFVGRE